ncbi:MAG: class A beta-lactamase-related serine hydrolase [Acidobacteria bacterium]|nr:MAG: class A beta-lactamase-related serine hydrolase [Acidobacteriota bacterium]REJ98025.1 MAG: class A beta-lactamase-related serine hydrolase [Acidobacteriota bacterium]REK16768.1 MAG: class A beta-lactamase-related serine hydrolase [Acidobacteriota bacterium]REK42679.1 MAG: class A beta-lactamase-related serine hydrolase [Acidobacteriota bacterium]
MKKLIIGLLVLGVFPIALVCNAQDRSDAIEEFLMEEMARQNIPGLSVVIARDGNIIHESHLGFANVELRAPVTRHTTFAIASMSKIYTAAAVHLLAERGTISLEDSIRKYLPDAPEPWQEITLQHLINHQSGLADDWTFYNDWENTQKSILATAVSNDELLSGFYKRPLLFEPGTDLRYQGGTYVLGLVIEKVTGLSYPEFMQKNIFEPLGLAETRIEDPEAIFPDRASGYLIEGGRLINGYTLSKVTLARGDVGVRASARDILKFLNGLDKGKLHKNPSRMHDPGRQKNGQITTRTNGGWFISFLRGCATREHGGVYRTGYGSSMFTFVDDGLTIVLLTNLAEFSKFEMMLKLASFYNPLYSPIGTQKFADKPGNDVKYSSALKALSESRVDPESMHERFPIGMQRHFASSFKDAEEVEAIGQVSFKGKGRSVFGVPIEEIVFVRFNETRYTAIYLAPNGKVIFVEIPENFKGAS